MARSRISGKQVGQGAAAGQLLSGANERLHLLGAMLAGPVDNRLAGERPSRLVKIVDVLGRIGSPARIPRRYRLDGGGALIVKYDSQVRRP